MATENYNGYTIRGFAKPMVDSMFEAAGAVERGHQMLGGPDPLGYYPTFERAVAVGLAWARAWVDAHH